MMKKSVLALLVAASVSASAQNVTKLAATKANDYGVAYSLPQTTVKIILHARKTVRTPGVFYNYSERYLGPEAARQAIAKASTQWELTGAELFAGAEIPAGAEQYLMQFKGGQPVFVALAETGNPLTVNSDNVPAMPKAPTLPDDTPLTKTPLDDPAARYAVTEDMLQGSSLAKRAGFAADQIIQLRQSRQDYLTGQADQMPDGQALTLILQNIQAQEEALTAMFLGTTQTATASICITYVPQASMPAADVVIARLNATDGFVDADDLSGAPVYLNSSVIAKGKLPLDEKGREKAFPKGGVPYSIPGSARFAVDFDGRTVAAETFDVTQLGVVFGLDPSFFTNKKEPGYAIFNPLTGGLREVGTK
ncbi:MAG: DUF4831 family protein [Muribaculaceae bacterium]|nr:DUF4831 family protein [Muribaculaceae bacterium]